MQHIGQLKGGKVTAVLEIRIVNDFLEALLGQKVKLMLDLVFEVRTPGGDDNGDTIHGISLAHCLLVDARSCHCRVAQIINHDIVEQRIEREIFFEAAVGELAVVAVCGCREFLKDVGGQSCWIVLERWTRGND